MGVAVPPPPGYSDAVSFEAGPQDALYFRLVVRWPGLLWPKIHIAINHPDDNWPDMSFTAISKQERIYRFVPPSKLTKPYEVRVMSKTFVSLDRLDTFRGALAMAQGQAKEKLPDMLDYSDQDRPPRY